MNSSQNRHYIKLRKLPLTSCFTLLLLQVSAQQPLYEEVKTSLSTEIRHVSGIAGDKNNCVWFTTQTGIYRYDGSHLKHFSVANTPVLEFERMAGISTIQGKNGLRWLMKDSKGGLYETDDQSRVRQFKRRENEEYLYNSLGNPLLDQNTPFANQSPIGDIVETFTVPQTGKAFFFTVDARLVRCNISDMRQDRKRDTVFQFPHGGFQQNTNKLFYSLSGMYAITHNKILAWSTNEYAKEVSISGDLVSGKNFTYDSLTAFNTTDPWNLVFVYRNDFYTVTMIDPWHLQTRLLIDNAHHDIPTTFYYSPAQQVFITYFLSRGLVFYRPRQFNLLYQPDRTGKKEEDYYYSIQPSANGLVSINNNGLIEFTLNNVARTLFKGNIEKYFLFKDLNGDLWFRDNGYLSKYSQITGQRSVLYDKVMPGIAGIISKQPGTYYILDQQSLLKCNLIKDKIEVISELYRSDINTQLNFLFEPRDNFLWIGTDHGLLEYDLVNNLTRQIDELKNTYLRSACKLDENNFLIGSYDKGIFQLSNGKWERLASYSSQIPASAHAFIIDKGTSSVWVSSNTGIYRIPLSELLKRENNRISFRHFTQFGPGIPSEFNGSSNTSGAFISDTCLAFANAKGVVIFNPRHLLLAPLPVNVLIESVNENDTISNIIGRSQHVEFNPVIPYHGNLQELNIEYFLSNSDKDWHLFLPNSIISYNNLKPGEHDLKFRIRHQNVKDEKELELTASSFYVSYKWYQTNWFKVLALLFIAAVVIAAHNIRIWYLRKRKRELEKMVQDKTRELKETNNNLVDVIDELSKSEYSLRQSNFLKDEYYAVLTHDLRSPLKFLAFHLSHLLERFRNISEQELKQGLAVANQTSYDIHKLIDEFAYWIQENEQQLVAQPAPVLINAIVEDAKKIYQYSVEENNNQFIKEVDPELTFITDPKLLFIIIRNAVDNANKYCRDGGITVTAIRINEKLEISVTDTGRGISEEMVRHLSSLQDDHLQLSYKQRKSLGFYIMAILTKKLGGTYRLISEKGNGTRLKFIFPELNLNHEDPDR